MRRTPPVAGTANSCDSSRAPSRTVAAFTRAPDGRLLNSARPASFVLAVTNHPRDAQLDVLPDHDVGKSAAEDANGHRPVRDVATGSGTPDICRGSGCADAGAASAATNTTTAIKITS